MSKSESQLSRVDMNNDIPSLSIAEGLFIESIKLMANLLTFLPKDLNEQGVNIDQELSHITPAPTILKGFDKITPSVLDGLEAKATDEFDIVKEVLDTCSRLSERKLGNREELYSIIKTLVTSESPEEDVATTLFNLLGFEEFDFISEVIQNKNVFKENKQEDDRSDKIRLITPEERDRIFLENQRRAKNEKLLPKMSHQKYPHVYKNPDAGNVLSFSKKKYSLPEGTTRFSYPTHEELTIPYSEQRRNKWISDKELVRVSQLDYLCKGTFKGYKTLNGVQSLVFPVAYNTNENMLICAPTGAGKTDIALFTILRMIRQYLTETTSDDNINVNIDYEEFKIVYVAPLKALAAEIVEKFSSKLSWLGLTVRELTGDMQLTKLELMSTQVIVTTPEKWDIVTRKLYGDTELVSKLKLLIIDEVHLLHEERGSVIETLVARTLRQVEGTQLMIRVIGLSATLPNFKDVADFLGVNRSVGMFYFDQSFRPCPLKQILSGVRGKAGSKTAKANLDIVGYDKLKENVEQGFQVMVFVHSRKDTARTARSFISQAQSNHDLSLFDTSNECQSYGKYNKEMGNKNRNKDMKDLFQHGFGIHHAGMLRSDRNLTEKMFLDGAIKVLCCTATLAWGVNLPAAVVIIKGTQIYDSRVGNFVDLGISDVLQIFGRAGRPQFEKFGTGILITTSDRLDHYISLITEQHPIESRLGSKLLDNLNAEICLGSVTTIDEGVQWLGFTYMMVRMKQNPLAYGMDWKEIQEDPLLHRKSRDLIISAARRLHELQMIIFEERSEALIGKDLGRIASEFYLLSGSVEIFNRSISPQATEADVLSVISMSSEFDGIKYREEEGKELKALLEAGSPCQISGGLESAHGKTNILIQSFISRMEIKDSALISDCNYVAQNCARICRALFLVGINRRWGVFALTMLAICKSLDRRLWHFDHPLAQFDLPASVIRNLRAKNVPVEELKYMDSHELGDIVHNNRMGAVLKKLVSRFPSVLVDAEILPITVNVLRVRLILEPDFLWDERYHGNIQIFWVLVEQSDNSDLLHVEKLLLSKKHIKGAHELDFMIPLKDPLPPQLVVRVLSDSWIGSESIHTISFKHLIRPTNETIRTNLLRLRPLQITALHNLEIERIYSPRFHYFNPMQTMIFHTLYYDKSNVFIGSPTGSGKTVTAELAMWQSFRDFPKSKIVYIAPMKALVRERVEEWKARICQKSNHRLVELTGDSLPDSQDVRKADIIITTPEKFDGISRNWQTRKFVQQISLVIMDEIHLLASDRGPILEMIVSRMNYISSEMQRSIRLLGMSTAVSNAIDMAGWLGVKEGLFNFPQSVRPVPLKLYIDGFQDNLAFSPLMKTMNKPAFMAIKQHSPDKPVLIFVASRRQTRLTALDLINLCALEANPRRFSNMGDDELEETLRDVKDETLRLALHFGMGLHHAGLVESDRYISHKLFESGRIQILITTSTLAWGVNLPAHLVIIKGTQYFDPKIEAYRDMDLTDILQMMGRAGRPSFDTSGTAVIFTKESKKTFYKHFLNIGFPVESSLHKVLDDHVGAEISTGTIKSRQEAMEFLTWTFLYRRAHSNPTYYKIEDISMFGVSQFLSGLIDKAIENLQESKCIITSGKDKLIATSFLHISSYYYLSHKTVRNLVNKIKNETSFRECLQWLCEATEYDELATRHGEDLINMEMSQSLPFPADDLGKEYIWDPHIKSYLLLQAYMRRFDLPIADYVQDTVSVLDQALRILQAYIDIAAELGYLKCVFCLIGLMQCIKQCCWNDDDPVTTLPGLELKPLSAKHNGFTIDDIGRMNKAHLIRWALKVGLSAQHLRNSHEDSQQTEGHAKKELVKVASHLPTADLKVFQNDPSTLHIELHHTNPPLAEDFKVSCPFFPKPQRESWFIILSDMNEEELFLMKRASPKLVGEKGRISCVLDIPEDYRGMSTRVHCINDAMDLSYVLEHELT